MFELKPLNVLISLRAEYADGLLSGQKCVELRRRTPAIERGTHVWLYSKVPVAEVVGMAVLDEIIVGHPDALWEQFATCARITQEKFRAYFDGVTNGAALKFQHVCALQKPLTLEDLRRLEPGFHPPQFFSIIRSATIANALQSSPTHRLQNGCGH